MSEYKLKEIYKVFYSLSITEWKEAIKEIIEKKLTKKRFKRIGFISMRITF